MISFILNNKTISVDHQSGMTLLDFIRYDQQLKGTKIGCREGDCGACTVLIGSLKNYQVSYISMTSCLTPLANVNGKHVVTVEGINGSDLTPVQQSIVDEGGTQCGFCTVGFVMSLTGCCTHIKNATADEVIAAMDGNICRCTGYKSLERAAVRLADQLQQCTDPDKLSWLVKEGFVPSYFNDISKRLGELIIDEVAGKGMITGGGTDLYVQKHETMTAEDVQAVFDHKELNQITLKDNYIYVGGAVTVEDIKNNDLFNSLFPNLQQQLKLISSTPIRNMATLAGNMVNASPIGDMTIFFLALDATLQLSKQGTTRNVALKDFYRGYKTLDKDKEEIVTAIYFEKPADGTSFSFEKVSKRTHLDIASVNSACSSLIKDNKILSMHFSMGGVFAFPKYLTNTSAFLIGKEINSAMMSEAINIMQKEIAPISDARGNLAYKRLLARQLFIAHLLPHLQNEAAVELISN